MYTTWRILAIVAVFLGATAAWAILAAITTQRTSTQGDKLGPEVQNAFVQKLAAESAPVVDPKLQALDARLRVLLGAPPAAPPASGAAVGSAGATTRPAPAAAKPAAAKASGK